MLIPFNVTVECRLGGHCTYSSAHGLQCWGKKKKKCRCHHGASSWKWQGHFCSCLTGPEYVKDQKRKKRRVSSEPQQLLQAPTSPGSKYAEMRSSDQGYLSQTHFKPFDFSEEMLPAFPLIRTLAQFCIPLKFKAFLVCFGHMYIVLIFFHPHVSSWINLQSAHP